MAILEKIKKLTQSILPKKEGLKDFPGYITVGSVETQYENGDYNDAAKDLINLLETYGRRKRKNHRYKGREFIHFILSNKHKDLKNTGYTHWQNLNHFVKLNQSKVYPYHKNNLRRAIDFYKNEIKGLYEIKIPIESSN
jgi:hypothetical protein